MPLSPYLSLFVTLLATTASFAESAPRARDLGIPLEGTPGSYNAITDVPGVLVGHTTLIEGHGKLVVGKGPIRTGVTAILPRGRKNISHPVYAGWFSLNGNGEMTGTTFIEEMGELFGPVMITNTHSVGVVRDAVVQWTFNEHKWLSSLPVVAETLDGPWDASWAGLNDANGFHVKPEHVFSALSSARGGPVEEGSVGGGTGMICNEFKGGIGTASRVVEIEDDQFTVGVLVQCNYGMRRWLRIAGVPVGLEMPEPVICYEGDVPPGREDPSCGNRGSNRAVDLGSIIVVVATDAPLLPHQLKRVARRVGLALGRMGSSSGDGSGDIFLAFSTANLSSGEVRARQSVESIRNTWLTGIFEATTLATEEAIINSMLAARTMVGADNLRVPALPQDQLVAVLKRYNRHEERAGPPAP